MDGRLIFSGADTPTKAEKPDDVLDFGWRSGLPLI